MHHLAVFPKWESWTWTESEIKQEPPPHRALLAQMWTLCLSGATVNTVGDWIPVSLTHVFTSPHSNSSGEHHGAQLQPRHLLPNTPRHQSYFVRCTAGLRTQNPFLCHASWRVSFLAFAFSQFPFLFLGLSIYGGPNLHAWMNYLNI